VEKVPRIFTSFVFCMTDFMVNYGDNINKLFVI
jgi:hypothetical protein